MTRPDAGFSDLYCCYNGMLLGFFLTGMGAEAIADEYPRLRRRVNEFLEEAGSLPIVQGDRDVYLEHQDRIVKEIMFGLSMFAPDPLTQYAHLGSVAMHYVLRASFEAESSQTSQEDLDLTRSLRAQSNEHLDRLGVPRDALDRFLEGTECDGEVLQPRSLHTASLEFVREVLRPVTSADRTAFVVMPFSLEGRYADFYLPVLEQLGHRGFRAWGGMSSEDYQPLMVDLIRASEAAFVDVTDANPNVLYELGLAHGMDKPVFIVIDEAGVELPVNLRDLAVARYDSTAATWPDDAVEETALLLKFVDSSQEMLEAGGD